MGHLRIAIDGPAGAGKSTVARAVAERLGILYVDTGAMYRGAAWLAARYGRSEASESVVERVLSLHTLSFQPGESGGIDVFADGALITADLRSPEVSACVSQISTLPAVRRKLTDWQRDFGRTHNVVMDGRDIGTVVLPDAEVKIFLTADIKERARRRAEEFRGQGYQLSLDEIEQMIEQRDTRDASRDEAPLRQATDAVIVDSTGKSVTQVVEEVLAVVEGKSHD